MSDTFALEKLSQARQAIAEARTIPEAKKLLDSLTALADFAKRQRIEFAIQNEIAESRIRTRRKLGGMLAVMPKAKGTRGQGRPKLGGNMLLPPKNDVPTLRDLGISKMESSRMQTEAAIPSDILEQYIAVIKAKEKELTSKAVYRLGQEIKQAQERENMRRNRILTIDTTSVYRAIVIDPPWPTQKIIRDERPNQNAFAEHRIRGDRIAGQLISEGKSLCA